MSVIAYIESTEGKFRKSGFEVATYAAQTAKLLGKQAVAVVIGDVDDATILGNYGIQRVIHINPDQSPSFDARSWAKAIAVIAKEQNGEVVVLAHSANGKALTGRIAVRLQAGSVTGVNRLPDVSRGFTVTKSVFSGKAIATYAIDSDVKVVSVMGNSVQPLKTDGVAQVEVSSQSLDTPGVKVVSTQTTSGRVPLPEAERVVSAGRGMKGPENWGIIEELAEALGATTACSRPVADSGWRPHHEHVGQTGVAIRPNLYIAAGISGAIQHLAGVNNSKTIVVINKDPEAPFFKAADYGVVGDVFDIIPRLTAAIKKFKQGS